MQDVNKLLKMHQEMATRDEEDPQDGRARQLGALFGGGGGMGGIGGAGGRGGCRPAAAAGGFPACPAAWRRPVQSAQN